MSPTPNFCLFLSDPIKIRKDVVGRPLRIVRAGQPVNRVGLNRIHPLRRAGRERVVGDLLGVVLIIYSENIGQSSVTINYCTENTKGEGTVTPHSSLLTPSRFIIHVDTLRLLDASLSFFLTDYFWLLLAVIAIFRYTST